MRNNVPNWKSIFISSTWLHLQRVPLCAPQRNRQTCITYSLIRTLGSLQSYFIFFGFANKRKRIFPHRFTNRMTLYYVYWLTNIFWLNCTNVLFCKLVITTIYLPYMYIGLRTFENVNTITQGPLCPTKLLFICVWQTTKSNVEVIHIGPTLC